tara:strand:- start:9 stop:542 length:534 start_codon:yes stop_codon:yes gene_type:complete
MSDNVVDPYTTNGQSIHDLVVNNRSFMNMIQHLVDQAVDDEMLQAGINQSLTDTVNQRNSNVTLNLPSVKYSTLSNRPENETCSVCIQPFKPDDNVWFNCHIFHYDCLEECVKYKPECPICRCVIDVEAPLEISTDIEQCEDCGENYSADEGHVCEELASDIEESKSVSEEISEEFI